MPRVKGGYVTRQRRKKVLKLAKGYFGSKHTLYKTAHEQVMRSLAYSYRDRKVRKRDFRKLWIQRINAACQLNGMKYSRFINGLNRAGIEVNRKMLAEMAVNDAQGFAQLVELAKQGLVNEPVVKNVVEEVVATPVVEEAPVVVEEVAAEEVVEAVEEVVEATEDLSAKTLTELKAMAKDAGIKGYSTMKKDELIASLSE